jgi:hypothetical protein
VRSLHFGVCFFEHSWLVSTAPPLHQTEKQLVLRLKAHLVSPSATSQNVRRPRDWGWLPAHSTIFSGALDCKSDVCDRV